MLNQQNIPIIHRQNRERALSAETLLLASRHACARPFLLQDLFGMTPDTENPTARVSTPHQQQQLKQQRGPSVVPDVPPGLLLRQPTDSSSLAATAFPPSSFSTSSSSSSSSSSCTPPPRPPCSSSSPRVNATLLCTASPCAAPRWHTPADAADNDPADRECREQDECRALAAVGARLRALERAVVDAEARHDAVRRHMRGVLRLVRACDERQEDWDRSLAEMLEVDTRRSREVARKQEDLAAYCGIVGNNLNSASTRPSGGGWTAAAAAAVSPLRALASCICTSALVALSLLLVTPATAISRWYTRARGPHGGRNAAPAAPPGGTTWLRTRRGVRHARALSPTSSSGPLRTGLDNVPHCLVTRSAPASPGPSRVPGERPAGPGSPTLTHRSGRMGRRRTLLDDHRKGLFSADISVRDSQLSPFVTSGPQSHDFRPVGKSATQDWDESSPRSSLAARSPRPRHVGVEQPTGPSKTRTGHSVAGLWGGNIMPPSTRVQGAERQWHQASDKIDGDFGSRSVVATAGNCQGLRGADYFPLPETPSKRRDASSTELDAAGLSHHAFDGLLTRQPSWAADTLSGNGTGPLARESSREFWGHFETQSASDSAGSAINLPVDASTGSAGAKLPTHREAFGGVGRI
jgi:hypothetical protein